MAKESVVSTLSVLTGSMDVIHKILTPASALSLLIFCLLYTPCVAAVSSVKRELGSKWALVVVVGQCVVAWIMAALVYARILFCESAVRLKCRSKLCKNQITIVATKITVNARCKKSFAFSHNNCNTFFNAGIL